MTVPRSQRDTKPWEPARPRLAPRPDDYALAAGTKPDAKSPGGRLSLPLPAPRDEVAAPVPAPVAVEATELVPAITPRRRARRWHRAPWIATGATLGLALAYLLGLL